MSGGTGIVRVTAGGSEGPWWIAEAITMPVDVMTGDWYILFGPLQVSTGPVYVTTVTAGAIYLVDATGTGEATFHADEATLVLHKLGGTITVV
jgi:hypothetical protein